MLKLHPVPELVKYSRIPLITGEISTSGKTVKQLMQSLNLSKTQVWQTLFLMRDSKNRTARVGFHVRVDHEKCFRWDPAYVLGSGPDAEIPVTSRKALTKRKIEERMLKRQQKVTLRPSVVEPI